MPGPDLLTFVSIDLVVVERGKAVALIALVAVAVAVEAARVAAVHLVALEGGAAVAPATVGNRGCNRGQSRLQPWVSRQQPWVTEAATAR
eukprot:scaffold13165_cov65-Phaeocystis_antarctica.AAC.3